MALHCFLDLHFRYHWRIFFMITLDDAAKKELDAFFSSHADTKKSVRVFVAPGG